LVWVVGIEQVQAKVVPLGEHDAPGPQTVLQEPQCWTVLSGTHWPPQAISPVGQPAQPPFVHRPPMGHWWPQVPQLLGSVAVAVHVPGLPLGGHLISPPGQAWQEPPAQAAPIGQRVPQTPQLLGSVIRSEHVPVPAQVVWPAGQAHCPEMHVAPTSHWWLLPGVVQAPQLLGSLLVLVQPPEQAISLIGQTHTPVVQVAPIGQRWLQAPQLALSVCSSTQVLTPPAMQGVSPAGQPQTPLVQVPPSAHLVPQALQLLGSVAKLVHTFWIGQKVWPAPAHWQAPPVQVSPCGQP
jgi:hypothetical protein